MFKGIILLSIICFCYIPVVYCMGNNDWYDSNFQYRNVYVIDSDLVDENLYDFPVLVYLNSSYVNWSYIQDDLDDLRFIYSSYSFYGELAYEIDSYSVNNWSYIWVKIPVIMSSVDTVFYMYYGSSLAESGEDSENVWDSNFKMVQHMNDNSTSTILDSTSNNNDGIKEDVNTPIESLGFISNSQEFNATNTEYIAFGDILDVDNVSDFCIEFYAKPDNTAPVSFIICKGDVDNPPAPNVNGYETRFYSNTYFIQTQDDTQQFTHQDGNAPSLFWNYYVFILDRASNEMIRYVNGSEWGTRKDVSGLGDLSNTNQFVIGSYSTNFGYGNFDGKIDEVRFSNISRSFVWIEVNYYSQTLQLISLNNIESFNDDSMVIAFSALIIACFCFVMVITNGRK